MRNGQLYTYLVCNSFKSLREIDHVNNSTWCQFRNLRWGFLYFAYQFVICERFFIDLDLWNNILYCKMFFLAKTCNPVVVPSGAMVRQSRCTQQNANNFNDVCIFYCLPGYQITDPAHTKLICGADALWKGTPPTCKRKYHDSIVPSRRYHLIW